MEITDPMKAVFAPLPAIVQKQEKTWMRLLQELTELVVNEDKIYWAQGDLLGEIEDQFDKKHVWEAAEQVHLTKQMARQRLWVAKRIPKGHRLRSSVLTFGHFRVLMKLDEAELEQWADKAINDDWSVARLMAELEAAGDQKAVEEGHPCIQCEKTLPDNSEVVAFTVKGMRTRCCNCKCAAAYFTERVMESGGVLDSPSGEDEASFSDGLDLSELPDPTESETFAL